MKRLKDIYSNLNCTVHGVTALDSMPNGENNEFTPNPDEKRDGGSPANGKDGNAGFYNEYKVNTEGMYDIVSAKTPRESDGSESRDEDSSYYYTEEDGPSSENPDRGRSGYYRDTGNKYTADRGYDATVGKTKNDADTKAVTGFVLSLIGLLLVCCCCGTFIGIALSIVGLIFCRSAQKLGTEHSGLALAGVICSIVGICLSAIYIIIMFFSIVAEVIGGSQPPTTP